MHLGFTTGGGGVTKFAIISRHNLIKAIIPSPARLTNQDLQEAGKEMPSKELAQVSPVSQSLTEAL